MTTTDSHVKMDYEEINIFDTKDSWRHLTSANTASGMNIRRCSCDFHMNHFFGVDGMGRYSYLLRMPEQHFLPDEELPTLAGYATSWQKYSTGMFFCITLNEKSDYLIFKLLCRIIIERLEAATPTTNQRVISLLKDVIKRCGQFFKKRNSPLSQKQARGLIGELIFLLDHVVPHVGWKNALSCWKGPLGAPQDFGIDNASIEVKATVLAESQVVNISSAEQLTPMQGKGYLFVAGLSNGLAENSDSFTLSTLVSRVVEGLEAIVPDDCHLFLAMVRQIGYTEKEKEANVPYSSAGNTFYALEGDFPRITVDMLSPGITDCKYKIDLTYCKKYIVTPDWIH